MGALARVDREEWFAVLEYRKVNGACHVVARYLTGKPGFGKSIIRAYQDIDASWKRIRAMNPVVTSKLQFQASAAFPHVG